MLLYNQAIKSGFSQYRLGYNFSERGELKFMKLYKNKIALSMAAILGAAALCSCSKGTDGGSLKGVDLSNYPINTDKTLTYWMDLPSNISSSCTNFGDTELAK